MPTALVLYCGAGGACAGLHQAGFEVVGVDNRRQPRYPFTFVQADALSPPFHLADFDFIWASPPCQAYSVAAHNQRAKGKVYPDHIAPIRAMLKASGIPYAIENVPGAPLIHPIKLRGTMFPGLKVIRERWFETSWFMMQPPRVAEPRGLLINHGYVSVAGNGTQGWAYKMGLRWSTADMRRAMGIEWMSRNELSQAIPPAYAEFIGRAALRYLENDVANEFVNGDRGRVAALPVADVRRIGDSVLHTATVLESSDNVQVFSTPKSSVTA